MRQRAVIPAEEGQVVTTELPLAQPMQLEVNVSCPTGYFAAEILRADGSPVEAYGRDAGRIESADAVRHRMSWGERDTVAPVPGGECRLRFSLYQGSFFSYRWSKAAQ